MVKFLMFIISIFALCDLLLSTNINCDYDLQYYNGLNTIYICKAKNNLNIISKDATLIESATGNHKSPKSNIDVFAFEAENKKIEYLPKGLGKIFENLKGIVIQNGRLKEIQQSDFREYPELVLLDLKNNDIAVLEDGVFDFVPNLKIIWLPDNKIIHVGEKVFENLDKLVFLFIKNTCATVRTMDYQTESIRSLQTLKNKCFDQNFSKLSTKLTNLEEDAKSLRRDNFYIFSLALENLEKDFKSSIYSSLNSIKERLHVLKFANPESVLSKNSCQALNLENIEGSLKAAMTKTLAQNLEKFQESSCRLIDERIASYNLDLGSSFSALMDKLRETNKNIGKWQELDNYPNIMSKRMGKFECDQIQFAKREVHNMKLVNEAENVKFKKLEERIGKIEENIEKILQSLSARN